MELLSPAGDLQKLQFALAYGADAVYVGGEMFSLRQRAGNLSLADLQAALDLVHRQGRRLYLTLNAFLHQAQWQEFQDYLRELAPLPIDGYILSDLGAIAHVRETYPEKSIHISTQANTTNAAAVRFYQSLGISRIVLARELSLTEIAAVHRESGLELEAFVHGAMCIAYSGRCLLSNYFTNPALYGPQESQDFRKKTGVRDANQGDCSQTCRWEYQITEAMRPDEPLTVGEDPQGTYILSSRDLNMAAYIRELSQAGISSFKIEGRVKSLYYTANVTRVYRAALDLSRTGGIPGPELLEELNTVSHRPYTTGFYFEHNRLESLSATLDNRYIRPTRFLAYVQDSSDPLRPVCRAANQIRREWCIEAITPSRGNIPLTDFRLIKDGQTVDLVQPNDIFTLECGTEMREFDIIRMFTEQ